MRSLRHATLLALLLGASLTARAGADEAAVVATIYQAADDHGISRAWLLNTARCESALDPFAVGRLGEQGLFQLLPGGELRTFRARGFSDPFNATEAAQFTAARFAEGGSRAWSCAR